MQFDIAIRASQGARRAQEDSARVWAHPKAGRQSEPDVLVTAASGTIGPTGEALAVLCDGMGGHAGGALASSLCCENFVPHFLAGAGPVRDRLIEALEEANHSITRQIEHNPAFLGMGSTLVAVHVDPYGLSWVSVGDSLLYLWRRFELLPLNADHSLAPEIDKLAESGKISWEAARNDPRRHYLRSALTGDEIEMIDLSEAAAPLLDGDVVVLASDGINTLDTTEIAAIIGENKGAHDAARIADQLIARVDSAGQPHQDNTTIVVICVSGPGAEL